MFQGCIELFRLTSDVLLQAADGVITLLGLSGGEDECEALEGRPRSNEFIDQSATYGKAEAAVPMSDPERKSEIGFKITYSHQ